MSLTKKLLEPLVSPYLTLRNRVVMAPMNRRRAIDGIPSAAAPVYYGQRAAAGLMLTDNTAITPNGIGYLDTPGIYNAAQKAAWKSVAGEVHARNGKIFIQLVHAGRIGHPVNHGGSALVAPSVIQAAGSVLTASGGQLPIPAPEALAAEGIKTVIDAYIRAAADAIDIGFDGVEIHGAHGFLPDQFLNPHSNRRGDRYGGNIPNRSRFLLEIMEGVSAAIGKEYTGVRLSPFATYNDLAVYDEETATHQYIVDALQQMGILYIHLSGLASNGIPLEHIKDVRARFHGLLILAGGYTADSGELMLQEGLADLIAYGKAFIANPDLVQRFCRDAPLNVPDATTFYHGGDRGYIDYPAQVK